MNEPFDAEGYWEQRLNAHFDLQGVGDIGLPVAYNEYLYRVRRDAFRRASRAIKVDFENSRILDVGSGTGFYIRQWLDLGVADLTGSDLTQASVTNLGEKFPSARFVKCDIGAPLSPPLQAGHFDVVSAMDMLFHIVDETNYAQAITNFAALLLPGGYLIFSDNLSGAEIHHGPHQTSRTELGANSMLEAAGFAPVATFPMFVLMNDPVRSRSRLLHRLFRAIYGFAAKGERQGRLIGALLYPVERLLLRLLRRGPSTEIFIWRKNG